MESAKEQYKKYKLFIWPIVTGLSFIIILALAVIPQIRAYMTDQGRISELKEKSNTLSVKASELEQINETTTRKNLGIVLRVLPTSQDVPEAMVTLMDVINKSGLILRSTNYSTSSRADIQNNFKLNVVVFGPIAAIRNFLINLQESPRVFQIDSMNVKFQPGELLAEAELPITVFFEPAKKNEGSLEQPVPKLNDTDQQLLANLSRLMLVAITASGSGEPDTSTVPIGKVNPFE